MKTHDVKQGSDEWLRLRAGLITASEFDRIMTPTFKAREGQTPLTFLYEKLAERCMGAPLPSLASTWHMENGQILEAEARGYASVTFDMNIERVGFITDDTARIGASPDGLLGEDGGLELKCCAPQTHVRYMIEDVLPDEYKCQVHGSLYVSGRKYWQFGSYARGFPFFAVRVNRDEEIMRKIDEAIKGFVTRLDAAYAKIAALAINTDPRHVEGRPGALIFPA